MQVDGREKLTRYLKELRKMDADEVLPVRTVLIQAILEHEFPQTELSEQDQTKDALWGDFHKASTGGPNKQRDECRSKSEPVAKKDNAL